MKKEQTKLIVTGGLAGLANGFFGSGGGLFLVPLFISWSKMKEKTAFATSVGVILPICVVSAVIYGIKSGIDVQAALPYLIGGAAGGLISGKLFQKLSLAFLHRIFGALILYGGLKAVFGW